MHVSNYDLTQLLRSELATLLRGPGITWNLAGILQTYDRACAITAFKVAAMELPQKENPS